MRAARAVLTVALAAATALSAGGCKSGSDKPLRRARQRVFVMGFDGMDPTLSRKFMDEGKLPNLKKLAETGTFAKLETTQPSESPVAWASFATGVNPGKHNIYDFLVRDFQTYMPDLGGVKREPPKFLWGWLPTRKPKITSTRGGTSFWVHAGRDGIRSVVLTVPMTFPPEEIANGQMLAGLPLPDIRGTLGTFYYWATDLSSFEEGNAEFGGYLKRLLFDGGVAETFLRGPESPILRQEVQDCAMNQSFRRDIFCRGPRRGFGGDGRRRRPARAVAAARPARERLGAAGRDAGVAAQAICGGGLHRSDADPGLAVAAPLPCVLREERRRGRNTSPRSNRRRRTATGRLEC